MPSKYRAFKEAADRIVELERDLAAREAELAAKDATIERLLVDSEAALAHITALQDDRQRLQQALFFWMPSIAGEETPAGERAAKDSVLLVSPDLKDEPSAYELGWIVMDSEAKLLREERNIAEQRAEAAEERDTVSRDALDYLYGLEAATALDEALAIARELARLSRCMDAIPRGSIGTQVALLEALERRVGVLA